MRPVAMRFRLNLTPSIATVGFPDSALRFLVLSERSPSKTHALDQEAAADNCSEVVVCTGPMPLNSFFVKREVVKYRRDLKIYLPLT